MSKVYKIVQERILERLENAINSGEKFTWVKPWNGLSAPQNFDSKKAYSGINLLLLPMGGYYLTMKQINSLGGKVIKGSKPFPVVYWSFIESNKSEVSEEAEALGETKKVPIFKYYNVFHQSQVSGIEFPSVDVMTDEVVNNKAEELVELYSSIVSINEVQGSNEAYYTPTHDGIYLPKHTQFESKNKFYATAFHEMIHSTGHKTRLDRFKEGTKFGSEIYSKEELVAEIGASMLLAHCGIEDENIQNNSIAYLKGWYEQIKTGNVNEITIASQQAQKAFNFIVEKVDEIKNLETDILTA